METTMHVWLRLLMAMFVALAAQGLPLAASAHAAPDSALMLDLREDHMDAELLMPLDQLEIALGQPLAAPPEQALVAQGEVLSSYVLKHVAVRAPDGRAWLVKPAGMSMARGAGAVDLAVRLQLSPPPGAPLRRFTLKADAIGHQVPNHMMLVSVRGDWRNGIFADAPHLVGTLRFMAHSIEVNLASGSHWQGIAGVLKMGMRHIADGTDHLLFVLTLLLPAPLVACGKRWVGGGSWREGGLNAARIVTAFTAGHSLTLCLGALGLIAVPQAPVEVAIALSIGLSSLHAMRPVFPGREPWVAAGFGLIHGLAFGSAIAELGLHGQPLVLAMAAFNLGVEGMQLIVVGLCMPLLMLAARSPGYRSLRVGLAMFAALAATGWAGERAFGLINPFAPVVSWFASRPVLVLLLLAMTAAVLSWRSRRKPSAATSHMAT
jgi:hypothetical protein